ncbi:hypothetical protein MTO96_049034 [Rhipicephalus appendiculatus]
MRCSGTQKSTLTTWLPTGTPESPRTDGNGRPRGYVDNRGRRRRETSSNVLAVPFPVRRASRRHTLAAGAREGLYIRGGEESERVFAYCDTPRTPGRPQIIA